MTRFKGKQFQQDITMVAVGYYLRYNLSYRDVSEILNKRGIDACHTTVYRWVQEYSQVAYAFFKRLINQLGGPRVLVIDKEPSLPCAFKILKSKVLFTHTEHRTSKYLNNLIEKDLRPIKKKNKDLYKKTKRWKSLWLSVYNELSQLMGIST